MRDDPLECKRRLAYLPDDPQLYDYMTGIQYLDFIADIFGVSAAQRAQRIRQYGDAFGLTPDLAQSIGAYSHGMKQKLAIIAAWIHQPRLILMDEPTSALDPISTSKIEDLVLELKDNYTIIMVTHNMQQATRISDKTAFFLLGEVVEFADTDKLFSMPADKRTEDYITGRFG